MTFVPTNLMATEDIPTSSISLSVYNASNDNSDDVYGGIDSDTGTSSFCNGRGNSNAPSQEGADELMFPDENPFKKRKAHSMTHT